MKKFIVMLLALAMVLSITACKKEEKQPEKKEEVITEAPTTQAPVQEDKTGKSEGVMTFAEYAAAPIDSQVTIETYVQAKQSWWEDKGTFYTQDEEGGYFLYSMPCSKEDYDKLVTGTKIKVTGYKSEWSGEVEITDATFEIEPGTTFVAASIDVTALLGSELLNDFQNRFIGAYGLTVEAQDDGSAFLYNWDGSGSHDSNSDLYFTLSKDGTNYSFTVESYLCDNTTDVYAAVENLHVGDVVNVEGFLYWYNGAQPHVTSLTVVSEGSSAMSYAEYAAAEFDSAVTVETYIQAKQSWWDGKGTFYTQDKNGGYFLYELPCTEEEYNQLVPGTHVRVSGYKSQWADEVEIIDSTYEIIPGTYIAEAEDITALLGTDELVNNMNKFVSFKGMTVEAQDNGAAFLYNWDGSGAHDSNSDLYFTLSKDGAKYSFTVESYLCNNTTDVYAAVENLKVGDVIDVEGFLYWYNGAQPHVTAISK